MSAAIDISAQYQPGDVLSPSSASGFLSCGFKWFARHVLHLPDPPTGARTMGSALHAAIGTNFEQKIETRQDLDVSGVSAIYNDAWNQMTKGEYPGKHGRDPELATEFRDDENPAELKAQGLALTLKYLDEACPEIQPAAVELPVAGPINGVWVRGYIDLLDATRRIIDIKTAAKKPNEISNDYRFQVATYAQLAPEVSREMRVDTLVKTKTPQLIQLSATVEESDVEATARQYPIVQRTIRAGVFNPNRSSYLCSRKYCSYWRACQHEFGGKVPE